MDILPATELQQAADRAAQGVRDFDDMRKALAEANRAREDLRQTVGDVDIAVELVREVRHS